MLNKRAYNMISIHLRVGRTHTKIEPEKQINNKATAIHLWTCIVWLKVENPFADFLALTLLSSSFSIPHFPSLSLSIIEKSFSVCHALCMSNVSEKFPFSVLILSHLVVVGVIIAVFVGVGDGGELMQCCQSLSTSRN